MSRFSPATQAIGLAAWLGLCFLAAAVGGLASASAGSFYGQLVLMEWAPPASAYGPVWTVLLTGRLSPTLIGLAAAPATE